MALDKGCIYVVLYCNVLMDKLTKTTVVAEKVKHAFSNSDGQILSSLINKWCQCHQIRPWSLLFSVEKSWAEFNSQCTILPSLGVRLVSSLPSFLICIYRSWWIGSHSPQDTKTVIKQKSYSVEVNWEAASRSQGSPDHQTSLISGHCTAPLVQSVLRALLQAAAVMSLLTQW